MKSIRHPVERIPTVAHRLTSEQNLPTDPRLEIMYECRRCGGHYTRYVETPAEAEGVHAYPVCLECQHYLGAESEPVGHC
jgi:hypothetical protein